MPVSSYEQAKAEREAERAAALRREQRRRGEIAELERMASLPDERAEGLEAGGEPEQQPQREKRRESAYDRIQRAQKLKKKWEERLAKKGGEAAARQLGMTGARVAGQAGIQAAGGLGAEGATAAGGAAAGESAAAAGTLAAGTAAGGTTAAGGGAAAGAGTAVGAAAATEATPVGWVITIIIAVILAFVVLIGVVLGSFLALCGGETGGGAAASGISRIAKAVGMGDMCAALNPGNSQGNTATAGKFSNQASPELSAFRACMRTNLPAGMGVETSIGDTHIPATCNPLDPDEIFDSSNRCQHAQYSCHYGGKSPACQAKGSYAVDYGDQQNVNALRTAAAACSASLNLSAPAWVNFEGNHVHISVGAAYGCGCN